MDRPITTLFMLMSVDGKISPGATDELYFDKDLPQIPGVREGLQQYYDIEQTTDLWSLNSGRVQAKMGVNEKKLPVGIIGLPVYANGTTGIGMILGNTGGYMIGWIFSGLTMWLLEKLLGRKLWAQAVSMLVGLLVCYALGTAWFMVVYARTAGAVGLWAALGWCVVPFLIPDLVKLGLALWMSQRLRKIKRAL